MHWLRYVLMTMVLLWMALACGVDADERMVRRYAECMTDSNTTLYRLTVSGAVGTVVLSAEAVEERLHVQLERGEVICRRSGPTMPATANRYGRRLGKGR